jgi:hypothetical protein
MLHNKKVSNYYMKQGTLTEEEGSVQLTSLYYFRSATFDTANNYLLLFYKTSYLKEEVNCTEPFPSVSILCMQYTKKFCGISSKFENDSRGQTFVNLG